MSGWLCRLEPGDAPGSPYLARQLGLAAWVVRVAVDAAGRLQGPAPGWARADLGLPRVLEVELLEPLSPAAEQRAAEQLAPLLADGLAYPLGGQPLLLLGRTPGFSHPQFARQRWLMSLALLLRRLGQPAPRVLDVQQLEPWPACYLGFVKRAHHGPWPEQPMVPCVLPPQPAWADASTELYGAWLAQAAAVSRLWHGAGAMAPVVLGSWEGHQQHWRRPPEAAAMLSAATPAEPAQERGWGVMQPAHLALLVHGFYLDRLELLLARLPVGGAAEGLPPIDLYVSTPVEQCEAAEQLLQRLGWPRLRLFGVPNRGRDLAPFVLQLLPAALAHGHTCFVKVHTKASPHLGASSTWGEALLDRLLNPAALREGLARLEVDERLALLGVPGTLLPITLALDVNAPWLERLQQRRGMEGAWLLQQSFCAGSMMLGRLAALEPLLQLGLELTAFEPELGQTDGTLAHALERWLSVTALARGDKVEPLSAPALAMPNFAYGWAG